eukprot:gene22622-29293_t
MADYLTAQSEELEVLLSIFPNEFELLSDDSAPIIDIKSVKGLIVSQIDELKILATQVANENIGISSVFMICDTLKEYLYENNIVQDDSMYADMQRRLQQNIIKQNKENLINISKQLADTELSNDQQVDPEEQERIKRREAGTPVTIESFMLWKKRFESERLLFENDSNTQENEVERPTGKQLFLLNKAGLEEAILASITDEIEDDDDNDSDYNEDDNSEEEDDGDEEDEVGDEEDDYGDSINR